MNHMTPANAHQRDQIALVQAEIFEVMNRLKADGLTPDVLLSGIANACADTAATFLGPDKVSWWFEVNAGWALAKTHEQPGDLK